MKAILALSLLSFIHSCSGNMPEGLPIRYEYRLTQSMKYPIEWHLLEIGEDGLPRLLSSMSGDSITIVRVPEDIFVKIDSIARAGKLSRLKSHYSPKFQILDGKSWRMDLVYPGHKSIYSCGYHSWPPKKLQNAIDEINRLLRDLVSAAKPEDIIGYDSHDARNR